MIPNFAPQSCWVKALFRLANEIADLPQVHAFLGVADTAAAKAGNIFLHTSGEIDEQLERQASIAAWKALFPAIQIGIPQGGTAFDIDRRGTGNTRKSGVYEVMITRIVDGTKADDIAEIEFQDEAGVVAEAIAAMFNLDTDGVAVNRFDRASQDGSTEYGEIHRAVMLVAWGTSSAGDT